MWNSVARVPFALGPLKDARTSTRDGARPWKTEELLSGLRRDDAAFMAHLESAVACTMKAKAKLPEVFTKRYEESNALHRFPLNRRRAAKAGLDKNEDASMRRLTGHCRQAVTDGSMCTRAALKLRRFADREKNVTPGTVIRWPITGPQLNATRRGKWA